MNASFEIKANFSVGLSRLWCCFTTPEHLCGWDPERVDVALSPGGVARWAWSSIDREVSLEVVAFEKEKFLALRATEIDSGAPSGDPERTGPALELAFSGTAQRSQLVLRHGADSDEGAAGLSASWWSALTVLRCYAENYFARPRRVASTRGVVAADSARAFALLQMALDEPGARTAYSPPHDMVFHLAREAAVVRARCIRMGAAVSALLVQTYGWQLEDSGFRALEARAREAVEQVCGQLGGESIDG